MAGTKSNLEYEIQSEAHHHSKFSQILILTLQKCFLEYIMWAFLHNNMSDLGTSCSVQLLHCPNDIILSIVLQAHNCKWQ